MNSYWANNHYITTSLRSRVN